MRTGTTQIGPVAPWFDIANSHQRHWNRTHRWNDPEHSSEYPPGLFPALADLDALLRRDTVRPRAAEGDPPVGMREEPIRR